MDLDLSNKNTSEIIGLAKRYSECCTDLDKDLLSLQKKRDMTYGHANKCFEESWEDDTKETQAIIKSINTCMKEVW